MNHEYLHVRQVTEAVHDRLVDWARGALASAGLDTVEVHSQFAPAGATTSHVVLFPYRLGPEPKMAENAKGVSLLEPPRETGGVSFVPPAWTELGQALAAGLRELLPETRSRPLTSVPHPLLTGLAPPLVAWFEAQPPQSDPWVATLDGQAHARLPALWWHPGYMLTVRYVVVATDPGRGSSARTSVHAPLGVNALSVLTAAIHRERVVQVRLPAPPLPAGLAGFVEALSRSVSIGERLRGALAEVAGEDTVEVAVMPAHDLTNQEFALLMQALQQPLQVALNLSIRLPLGAWPAFTPSSAPLFGEVRNLDPRSRSSIALAPGSSPQVGEVRNLDPRGRA